MGEGGAEGGEGGMGGRGEGLTAGGCERGGWGVVMTEAEESAEEGETGAGRRQGLCVGAVGKEKENKEEDEEGQEAGGAHVAVRAGRARGGGEAVAMWSG